MLPIDLRASQCNFQVFTPQLGKQWFTEAEVILIDFFIFYPALRFSKIVRELNMTTMLELETDPPVPVLISLQSTVLKRCTAHT